MLCEIDDQAQILNCVFINGADRVVDKAAGCQDSQSEDFGIVGGVFIQGPDALSIDYNDVDLLSIRRCPLNGSTPAPEPFGARIDSGSHSKSIASV